MLLFMPKEIKFVQCDCEKGKLEPIASTKVSWGFSCGDDGTHTIFYGCDSCERIFTRQRNIPAISTPENYLNHEPVSYSDYSAYDGKLTKEELIKNAQEHFGYFSSRCEKEIIEKRKCLEKSALNFDMINH